jgi:hypothetical protein
MTLSSDLGADAPSLGTTDIDPYCRKILNTIVEYTVIYNKEEQFYFQGGYLKLRKPRMDQQSGQARYRVIDMLVGRK